MGITFPGISNRVSNQSHSRTRVNIMVSIMLMCNDFCELFSIACRGKKHCVCNCAALWHTVKKMRKWTNCEQEAQTET